MRSSALQCVHDVLERVVDLRAHEAEHADHDDGDKDQYQRVLHQTLAFLVC